MNRISKMIRLFDYSIKLPIGDITKLKTIAILPVVICSLFLNACYTFKDISIKPDVKTFYIEDFLTSSANIPPTLTGDFEEKLRKKILSETSLTYSEIDPHITFGGTIVQYTISAEAPDPSGGSSLNNFKITINVLYNNSMHEDEDWEKRMTKDTEFDRNTNFLDVQDQLIEELLDLICEDVVNQAFSNW